MVISSTGDIIYSGSLYLNSKNGTEWFLMFGSIISSCTDGLMYTVEGPIITAYPEPDHRGRMLGLWVFTRNAAPVIGGPFIALLLSPPEKVQRRDGVRIVMRKAGWVQTFTKWYRVVSNRDRQVRVRALCSLVIPFGENLTGSRIYWEDLLSDTSLIANC
ncbi:hypothetical protein D9758_000814 [Tetrapyrgos nigripes]|uniref:Uncharacterized protein n=1 Tax=Tetrapyrgos nigripes TaxID=182062 RepID=A0A8H5LXM6_9AGAR|nr:hypothetical protein D9758_000814 [Tetrapyrgos nigripes]